MTNEEYHKAEGISASDFRLLQESPLHFENKELFKLSGSQFSLGSLVHKMVLEPETLKDEFVKEDFDGCTLNKNTKAYKEAKAKFDEDNKDKLVIDVDTWNTAETMAKNINAIAGALLTDGVAESSIFADDKVYGVTRKCRPDYLREDIKTCIDIKTTQDGSLYAFGQSIDKFNYALQAAWYIDTLNIAGYDIENFVFVTVESRAPYMVRVWKLDDRALEHGRRRYEELLDKWVVYKRTGKAEVVKPIGLPRYVYGE